MLNGVIILRFPASLQKHTSEGIIEIKISKTLMQSMVSNGAIPGLKFEQGIDSNDEISEQDAETIRQRIVDAIKSITIAYTATAEYSNETTGPISDSGTIGVLGTFALPSIDYSAMTVKNSDYTTNEQNPTPTQDVTLWGLTATFTKTSETTVTLDIPWTGSVSGDLSDIATYATSYVTGKSITVTFTKTGGNAGNDRVSFGKIAELKSALAGAASVSMQSSTESGKEVAPLFNGDDMYGDPYENAAYLYNKDRVFYLYNNGDEIFEGYEVRYGANKNNAHIYVKTGHSIIVDKLRFFKTSDSSKLSTKGFGLELQSGATISFVSNPSISLDLIGDSTVQAITPADLASALCYIGLDYTSYISGSSSSSSTPTAPLFTINAGKLLNDYSSSLIDVNIASSLNALKFLEKHADASKLGNLALSVTTPHLILQKSNPYTGNTAPAANQVSGNLAVWLGNKGVALREVYLTNPNLYTSATSGGTLRNVVLEGNNWKNITVAEAHGVIVSVNTPVAALNNPNNSNLWYVVQGGNPSTQVQINAKVLELGYSHPYANLAPVGGSITLDGLITPTSDRTGLSSNFSATKHYYTGSPNSARPTITWQQYAATVAGGGTPTFAFAPMDNSIRLAEGKTDAKDNDYLRMLANIPTHELADAGRTALESFLGSVYASFENGTMTSADRRLANQIMASISKANGFNPRNVR
ncbi:MAG: hypothetical protein LBQ61_03530, partial [Spirochaetales bacterium]|nr:hypothetical protein [Spirochaetales bacterium]